MNKSTILFLVMLVALAPSVPLQAAVLEVRPPGGGGGVGTLGDVYTTIQAAIDDANDGDTVTIHPGTYTEMLTISGKGLTVQGTNQSTVIVEAATAATFPGNVFTIDAAGKDITIQTMTIRHGNYGLRSTAGNVNVLHCTFYHNGWDGTPYDDPPTQGNAAAMWASSSTSDGGAMRIQDSGASEIAHCTVYENARGIRYQNGANGDIHDNVAHDNIESGIYLAASTYTGASGCSDCNVHDNESYANMNNGILSIGGINNIIIGNDIYDNWNSGVMLWHPANITVQGNTINHNNLYSFNGVGNAGDAYGGVYAEDNVTDGGASFAFKLLDNTISDNQAGAAAQATGLRLDETLPATGIEVIGNTFDGHDIDIHVRSQAATTTVKENCFDGPPVAIGIQNDDVAVLDATLNAWGDTSGPYHPIKNAAGTGHSVSDGVDVYPWYLDCTMASAADLPVHNVTQDLYYNTIQDGIDAASTGDQIVVAAGTYPEYLHITTDDLTIQGAGIDQSIIDLDGLLPYWHYDTSSSYASRGGVLISAYGNSAPGHNMAGGSTELIEDVTFTGFTVKNAGLNPPTPYPEFIDNGAGRDIIRGIKIGSGKNILIQNCKVENGGDFGISSGQARKTDAGTRPPSEAVTVDDCLVRYNHDNGVSIGATTGSITITDNEIHDNVHPSLPTGESQHEKGIQVSGRSNALPLAGTIARNNVSGNAYHGINLYRYTNGITVEDNNVTGHNLHWEGAGIFLGSGSTTKDCKNHIVRRNTVTGNIRGIIAYYVCSDTLIEENTVSTDSGTFDPGQAAIKIDNSYNITIRDNDVSCDGVGIELLQSGSYGNIIEENTIDGAMFAGVYIRSGAQDNTFIDNTITGTVIDTFTQFADWGTHDGANDQATLTDSTQFWTDDAFIGMTVLNLTDGSEGTITDNDATTITATLSGGSENDWDNGDEYDIAYDDTQGDGVFLRGGACYPGGHAGPNNVFYCNRIYGNADDGMENQTVHVVDAELNWWGNASGPSGEGGGSGDPVSENVDFFPWLLSTDCGDFTIVVADYVVDDDWDGLPNWTTVTVGVTDYYIGLNAFAVIQDAIDAASDGNSISVADGNYPENLVIGKSVQVIGAGGETSTIESSTGLKLISINASGSSVEFAGFTLKHISDTDWGSSYAILVENGAYANIHDNVVADFKKRGIYVQGSGSSADITGNTVLGESGVTGLQNGIAVWNSGGGFANIVNNEVSGGSYTGENWTGSGILILDTYDKVVRVKENFVYNNQVGIAAGEYCGYNPGAYSDDVVIQGNILVDNQYGTDIFNDIRGAHVVGNDISGSAEYAITVTDYNDEEGWSDCAQPNDTVIQYNNIADNNVGLTVNERVAPVNAEYNWWGDDSGPADPCGTSETDGVVCYDVSTMKNADGLGDSVTERADYCPWLNAAVSMSFAPYAKGDVNYDGCVNWLDVAILANKWLEGCE